MNINDLPPEMRHHNFDPQARWAIADIIREGKRAGWTTKRRYEEIRDFWNCYLETA